MKSIGNYEILEVIAEHGPTLICVAKHKKLGRKTFLKIFKSADPTLLQRFEREAKVVADLNDKHIVAIYDFGEEDGRYFISMEYVDGSNLREYLDEHGKLSAEDIVAFAYKITRAVAVLHEHGYIHRDLKPENILVSKDKKIKLTDFGIAFHEALHHVTTEGSLLGTPLYMSPEQINNLPVTPASDVFALGLIFYQMATGHHPFEAPRIGEIFSQILSKPVKNLCDLRPDLPDWFCAMVNKMLEKEPQNRYSSAVELLKVFKRHHSVRPPYPEAPQEVPRKKVPGVAFYLGGAAVMLLLIVLGWQFAKNMERKPHLPVADTLHVVQHNDSLQQALVKNGQPNDSAALAVSGPHKNPDKLLNKDNRPPTTGKIPAEKYVNVKIQTYPWCKIYLNYQLVDSTPMIRPLKLKPGKYLIGLQNPLYPSFTDSITIPAQKNYTLSFNLDSIFARLDLQVLPWGKVYIDGKYIGETPLQRPIYVTRGKHFIEVKNDFYVPWRDTLDFSGKSKIQKIIALKEEKKK